jgi:1-acyl-sn-glycerol-3-phosphate acyltransferase
MPHREFAVVFLAALPVLALVAAVRWRRRTEYGPVQAVLFLVVLVLVRVLWRAQVPPLPLTPGQGAVIVSNHRSSVDPFFLQVVSRCVIHWMVAREYCEHWAFGWFLRLAEVIPVNRGGLDAAATRAAMRLVAAGHWVGMFPEGRINMTDQFLLPGRPGAVLVARKAGVPILPCYIAGSPFGGAVWSPLLMPAKVTVKFGAPIDVSATAGTEREDRAAGELLLQTLRAIARLAGRGDFQPTLAGRKWKPTAADMERDLAALAQRSAAHGGLPAAPDGKIDSSGKR